MILAEHFIILQLFGTWQSYLCYFAFMYC